MQTEVRGEKMNSKSITPSAIFYAPFVIATHPYQSWFESPSPTLSSNWCFWMLVGAVMWRRLLDSPRIHLQWFPDAKRDGFWFPIEIKRVADAALWFYQNALINEDVWAIKRCFSGVLDRARFFCEGQVIADKSGADAFAGLIKAITEAITGVEFFCPSGSSLDFLKRNTDSVWPWLALLALTPCFSYQENTKVSVIRAQIPLDDADKYTVADLSFCWLGNGQAAWGIETDQRGGEILVGKILNHFSAYEGKLILALAPYSDSISAFFDTSAYNSSANMPLPTGMWTVTRLRIPRAGGHLTNEVAEELYKTLHEPGARKYVEERLDERYVLRGTILTQNRLSGEWLFH